MPWPVYTETFVRTDVGAAYTRYTVPWGRRAVVTSVIVVNTTGTAGSYVVKVGGIVVAFSSNLAPNGIAAVSLRAVAYEGQLVESWGAALGFHQTVSGYLFQNAAGRRNDPPLTVEVPAEDWRLEPVPA